MQICAYANGGVDVEAVCRATLALHTVTHAELFTRTLSLSLTLYLSIVLALVFSWSQMQICTLVRQSFYLCEVFACVRARAPRLCRHQVSRSPRQGRGMRGGWGGGDFMWNPKTNKPIDNGKLKIKRLEASFNKRNLNFLTIRYIRSDTLSLGTACQNDKCEHRRW